MSVLIDVNNILHVVGVLPPDLAGIDIEEQAGDTVETGVDERQDRKTLPNAKRRSFQDFLCNAPTALRGVVI